MKTKKLRIYKIIVPAILGVGLILLGYVYLYPNFGRHSDNSATKQDPINYQQSASDQQQQQELEQDPGKKSENNTDTPSAPPQDKNTGIKSVNVVLTSVAKAPSGVEASGFVSNVIESNGVCKFVFTNGKRQVVRISSTLQNPSSTTCKTVSVPYAEIAKGVWEVQLQYSSSDSEGVSNVLKVDI